MEFPNNDNLRESHNSYIRLLFAIVGTKCIEFLREIQYNVLYHITFCHISLCHSILSFNLLLRNEKEFLKPPQILIPLISQLLLWVVLLYAQNCDSGVHPSITFGELLLSNCVTHCFRRTLHRFDFVFQEIVLSLSDIRFNVII